MSDTTFKSQPARCPYCDMRLKRDEDVIGLRRVEFMCGMVITATPHADAEWRVISHCPNAASVLLEVKAALVEIVAQLKVCNYECQAGPLERNVEFVRLEELALSGSDMNKAFLPSGAVRLA